MVPLARKRALVAVVDDDREVREWLGKVLEREGFDVTLAANGLRLISALQVDRPSVILLDVMMSWINGFELCEALKKNPDFREVPVVFISGKSEPADRARGARAGAVGYFAKPLDSRRLVQRLSEIVEGGDVAGS